MVQRVQVTQVDDLDGSPAVETVKFALDGQEYEIDLSAGHAGELRAELGPYVSRARRKPLPPRRGNGNGKRKRKPSRPDLPEIRDYARARGHDIKERGQVPRRIVEEYDMLRGYRARA